MKQYPAMWVVFDKVDFRKGCVQSGNIWVILSDKDIIDFEDKNIGNYALSLRTTETMEGISMASLLTLDIVDGYVRPVVLVKDDITCLIDTGADIPVWARGLERLKDAFNAEIVEGKKFILSGFHLQVESIKPFRYDHR